MTKGSVTMEKVTKIDFFEIDFLGVEKVRKLWTFWKPKSPISKIFWHFSTFCGTYRSGKAKSQSKKYPDFLLFDEHTVRSYIIPRTRTDAKRDPRLIFPV